MFPRRVFLHNVTPNPNDHLNCLNRGQAERRAPEFRSNLMPEVVSLPKCGAIARFYSSLTEG